MRGLWKRRAKDREGRYLSVLDLGASTVKALVVERTDGQVAVLGRGQVFHRRGIRDDSTIGDVDALKAACERALTQAEDATEEMTGNKIVPDAVLMAVPTAWSRGAVGVGRVRRTNLEDGIVAEERVEPALRAGQNAMRSLSQVTEAGEWELLDATIAAYSIDGRRVTDPVGFRGHALEAMSVVTAAPNGLLTKLRQIADELKLEPPTLIAEPLSLAAASPEDGLIIQAGAQTTAMILVRYGAPLSFASITQGGTSLAQSLVDAFRISMDRADGLLRAYSLGRLNGDDRLAIQGVLGEPLAAWLSAVLECLRSWGNTWQEWSPNIYLCGGASTLKELQDLASTTRWLEMLPFPYTPQVRAWDGSNLSQVIDRTGRRWQLDNVTAISVAAWALRDRSPTSPDGMLRASLRIK